MTTRAQKDLVVRFLGWMDKREAEPLLIPPNPETIDLGIAGKEVAEQSIGD